jgi:L-alanine-DL-glutamate epimerase-like enolase superfamily enzyme
VVRSTKKRLNTRVGDVEIDEAHFYQMRIPLTSTFAISLGSQDSYESVVVELHTNEINGFGEGATMPRITGETPGIMYEALCYILDNIKGKTFESLEAFTESVGRFLQWNPTAKNAIDMAIHDLTAKNMGVHVTKLLGGHLIKKETSMTVGLGDVKSSIAKLEEFLGAGAKMIKLKVGGNMDTDVKRINALAKRIGKIPFYADANQGYSLGEALKLSKVLLDTGAIFFEQPLDRYDFDSLKLLRTKGGVPIMLDESIFSPRDVIESIRKEAADYVNVKLAKSGGIRGSLKTLTAAQAYGVEAMIGCMIESKLSTTAALATASAARNVRFTDLDGYLSLVRQPFEGGIELANGTNTLLDGKGLAIEKRF